MKRAVFAILGVLISAPSWAHGGGHFASPIEEHVGIARPSDTVAPPDSHGVGVARPYDTVAPPDGRGVGFTRPYDTVAPPDSHNVGIDTANGPLVKPAWKD